MSVGTLLAAAVVVGAPAALAPQAAPAVSASAPAPVTPVFFDCPSTRVDEVVHLLAAWAGRAQEAYRTATTDRGCQRPEVLCLDRLGDPRDDKMPDRVRAGEWFSVEVILPVLDSGKVAISMSGARASVAAGPFAEPPGAPPAEPVTSPSAVCVLTPAQRDQLKAAAAPVAQMTARPGLEALGVPAGSADDAYWMNSANSHIFSDWSDWAAAHAGQTLAFTAVEGKVEVAFAQPSLDVEFVRIDRGSASPSVDQHLSTWIDSGTYHLEASVLVPFVFRGKRVATLTPTPGGNQFLIGLDEDWHITAAVMVDLFPFGRQKGQVSSFEHCRSGSCVENWLGLQFGTGLSSIFQEWYLGLLFEPVSGVAIGAGGALLKGDFLGPGLAEGMLLPSPAQFSVNSDYMIRPYFGIALTSDIFQTLDRSSVFSRVW
jgi:hypothetical protein